MLEFCQIFRSDEVEAGDGTYVCFPQWTSSCGHYHPDGLQWCTTRKGRPSTLHEPGVLVEAVVEAVADVRRSRIPASFLDAGSLPIPEIYAE